VAVAVHTVCKSESMTWVAAMMVTFCPLMTVR
jgi:hypothetical protein